MAADQAYWDAVGNCREMLAELVLRAEEWIKKQPEIHRLLRLQNRAANLLSCLRPARPGSERKARRARLLYEGRCSELTTFWLENEAFAQELQAKFDSLSTVLGRDEIERRKRELNWADPVSILQALRNAAQKLDEFWQCRPGQSLTRAVEAGSESGHRTNSAALAKKRPGYRAPDKDPLAEVRTRVIQMHAEKLTQAEMCDRLGNLPRPPMAKWRGLSWPTAFRNPNYRDAVKTKLSKLVHPEISEFPR